MLVILDRDGVINKNDLEYITCTQEWEPIEGSIEAISRLSSQGYTIAIATNQSGVGRGYFTQDDLQAMHDKMHGMVKENGGIISHIAYCPHHPEECCECRKPKTGLLVQIRNALKQDLQGAYMVGDSLKDLQAAKAVGITPILVRTGNGLQTLQELSTAGLENVEVFNDLASFVDHIL